MNHRVNSSVSVTNPCLYYSQVSATVGGGGELLKKIWKKEGKKNRDDVLFKKSDLWNRSFCYYQIFCYQIKFKVTGIKLVWFFTAPGLVLSGFYNETNIQNILICDWSNHRSLGVFIGWLAPQKLLPYFCKVLVYCEIFDICVECFLSTLQSLFFNSSLTYIWFIFQYCCSNKTPSTHGCPEDLYSV